MRAKVMLVAAGLLTACIQPPPPYVAKTSPSESDLQSFSRPGTGKIEANALIRQQGGGVVNCAGSVAELLPSTAYSDEVATAMMNGYRIESAEYNTFKGKYLRQTTCDSQGNFSFEKLPAGTYWISTAVMWVIGYQRQGGALAKKVTINDGEQTRTVLTTSDYYRPL